MKNEKNTSRQESGYRYSAFVAVRDNITSGFLIVFNCLYRVTMIFLFTFFAYDSAKAQLKKTDLTK